MSTIPPLNEPSFRLAMESQIAALPPEHQTVIRSQMNALTDIYQAFTALNTKVNSIKSSVSSTSSASGSSSSSSSAGVTPAQAANIATQTIQSTLNGTNNQTGTSYTVQNSDYLGIVTLKNTSPVAVTLGGDGTGVGAQFGTYLENLGAGTATLTPANSATINGAANISLVQNQGAVAIYDGENWYAVTSVTGGSSGVSSLNSLTGALSILAGTGISVTPSGSNITITNTGTAPTLYTVALSGTVLAPGSGTDGTTVYTAPPTAVLCASLYDPTSPGANEFLSAFAYNQNGTISWSIFNVSSSSVTLLSSTVLNIAVLT